MGVFVIGCLEHLRRFLVAENGTGCERFRGVSGRDEALCHFGFDAVDNETAADRATGRYWLVQSFKLYHCVAHRRAGIENNVSEIAQLLAIRPLACAGIAVGLADEGCDENASSLKTLGDLHRHDVATATANH